MAAAPKRLSPAQVATLLGVSVRTVSHYATAGRVVGKGANAATVRLVRKRDDLDRPYLDAEAVQRFLAEIKRVAAQAAREEDTP